MSLSRVRIWAAVGAAAGIGAVVMASCAPTTGAKRTSVAGTARSSSGQAPTSGSRPTAVSVPDMPSVPRAETRERALSLLTVAAKTGTPEERANALEALTVTPGRLQGVVEEALMDSNEALRTVAAMAVGKAKLSSMSGAVAPLLNDSSPWVRGGALFAMKRCGQSVNLGPLSELLVNPSPRLRAHAAFILGELGETSAVPMLRDIARQNLNRANPAEARLLDLQIAEARLKLGDDAALAEVRAALFPAKVEDLEAAVLACQVVGAVKDHPSANALINLASQNDSTGQAQPAEVRLAAAAALAQLNHEPRKARFVALEYFAGEQDTLRAQSAFVLGLSREPSMLAVLSRMMDDPVGRVRIAAAAAIVRMTDQPGG